MSYQLQAKNTVNHLWYACTVNPVGWRLLLSMVALWRKANPHVSLRAVPWSERV